MRFRMNMGISNVTLMCHDCVVVCHLVSFSEQNLIYRGSDVKESLHLC